MIKRISQIALPSLVVALLMAATLRALPRQEAPPANTIEPPTETVEMLPVPEGAPEEIVQLVRELADEGVVVDFERRVVEVTGVVLLDRMNAGYPIEYLIVTEGGFTHEAFGMVRCTPSKLNAALLALGLTPGKTVRYERKDPQPPAEKIISGEAKEFNVYPPEGDVVDVAVQWTDDKGEHLHPIEDMITYITNGKTLPRRGFVYVGSRFQRVVIGVDRVEKFLADVEGNLVSLYLSGSGSCLFDMNSAEGTEAYLYDINTRITPERGTRVQFVFSLR